jgi:AraC-like DNA-binding protein
MASLTLRNSQHHMADAERIPMHHSSIQLLTKPNSDLVINLSPTAERILRRTSLVSLGEHRCPPTHPLFEVGGGPQTCPYIGFMRSTVIRAPEDSQPEVQTPNVAGFHNVGSCYRRRAVDDAGDVSDWIALSPSLLAELVNVRLDSKGEQNSQVFSRPFAPISSGVYLAQRHLMEVLNTNADVSDLAVEEYVIRLVRIILDEANEFWDTRAKPKREPRPTCELRRVSIVEVVKERIATEYWSNQSLASLASSVHCSAGQLARIFPAQTGFSIHSYQQHIRLRVALQLLRETPFELCDVAAQLGFANHSHFSTVFKRQFGIPPSEFAKSRSRGLLRSFLELLDRRQFRELDKICYQRRRADSCLSS